MNEKNGSRSFSDNFAGTGEVAKAGSLYSDGLGAYAQSAKIGDDLKQLTNLVSGFGKAVFGIVGAYVDYETYKEKGLSETAAATTAVGKGLASKLAGGLATPVTSPIGGIAVSEGVDLALGDLIDNTIDNGILNTAGNVLGAMIGSRFGLGIEGYQNGGNIADSLARAAGKLLEVEPGSVPTYAGSGRIPGELPDMRPGQELNFLDQLSESPANREFYSRLASEAAAEKRQQQAAADSEFRNDERHFGPEPAPSGGSAAGINARIGNDPTGPAGLSPLGGNRPDGGNGDANRGGGHDSGAHSPSGDAGAGLGRSPSGGSAAGTAARTGNDLNGPSSSSGSVTSQASRNGFPIILDLAGTGIAITELTSSNKFIDSEGTGLLHRTAWAGVGSGVLFYDADGNGAISQKREYVFTEWDPTAKGDLEALRNAFDSNGDGVLDAGDDGFALFKIEVTNADGSTSVVTLAEAGIVSINLTADLTNVAYADGSAITGQTTFTRSDTTTGTVANTTLAADANGYAVVTAVSTDGSGNRVVVNTAYAGDGSIAQAIRTVTSPDGHNITTSFDYNGDGVVDQVQAIAMSIDGAGIKTEMLTNSDGGGVLESRIQTVTSADGKTVTISRDSAGAGTWFDQTEVRTTHGDGHRTIVITDLNANGSTIRSETTNLSIDGLTRTVSTDLDGSGTADSIVTHALVIAGSGVRTETITTTNYNTSLRHTTIITTSADGREQTVVSDLDGDTDTDRTDISEITVNVDGTTDSVITVKNGDNSVRSTVTVEQSADSLSSTETRDVNGDSVIDLTITDVMVINGDTSRDHTVSHFNTDTSLRSSVTTHIGADRISKTVEIDSDGNGTTDVEQIVAVDGAGVRTATNSTYNADESLISRSVSTTSADGLSTTTAIDIDGNATTDMTVADVTVLNVDQTSTRTITATNNDTSLHGKSVIDTSANGLSVTTKTDIDGNGSYDGFTTDVTAHGVGNAWTRTVTEKAGNNSTLLGVTVESQSADRLTKTVTSDSNGDGANDSYFESAEASNGTLTETLTLRNYNQSLISRVVSTTSDDGLASTTLTDLNGDESFETSISNVTTLNADGSRTQVVEVRNADDSLRSKSVTAISDDSLIVTEQVDSNGDATYELVRTSTTVLNADGSRTTTIQDRNADTSLRSAASLAVSDDSLSATSKSDINGDGTWDFLGSNTTTLGTDGSVTTTETFGLNGGPLLWETTTVTSDDGRSVAISRDLNGDSHDDQTVTRIVEEDGDIVTTATNLNADGSLQDRTTTSVNDNGLITSVLSDFNGDLAVDDKVTSTTVLNADGGRTTTVSHNSANDSLIEKTIVTVSDDGLARTATEDFNGDGTVDLTTISTRSLAANGIWTDVTEIKNSDNSLREKSTTITSADQRTITTTLDIDGNGISDETTVHTIADNGDAKTARSFFSTAGTLVGSFTSTTNDDGLITTTNFDSNGDGRLELYGRDETSLNDDGSTTRTVNQYSGNNRLLSQEASTVSDDGFSRFSSIDSNGDGVFEFVSSDKTTIANDGTITRTIETYDGSNFLLSHAVSVTSGNGLNSASTVDYNGDGGVDRTVVFAKQADGSTATTTHTYGTKNDLLQKDVITISADQRTETLQRDSDGDGYFDRFMTREIDLSRNLKETFWDTSIDGTVQSEIVSDWSTNGLSHSITYDFTADGLIDLTRSTSHSFDAIGNDVVVFSEVFGTGTLGYRETSTRAANGFLTVTEMDLNGDGVIDETRTDTLVLPTPGGRIQTSTTLYDDGSVREKAVSTVSADGRTTTWVYDKDGNGVADELNTREIAATGRVTDTTAYLSLSGVETASVVMTTSEDGLLTTIDRTFEAYQKDNLVTTTVRETIQRSSDSNGSYVWNNGIEASTNSTSQVSEHLIDGNGVETWTLTSAYVTTSSYIANGNTHTTYHDVTEVVEIRLDATGMARLFDAANRMYDSLLDRDMTRAESEVLILNVVNGELDKEGLAQELIASGEFTTRYGTVGNSENITHIYQNALGRTPSLEELHQHLSDIASGVETLASIAVSVSESSEHILAGNNHAASNNTDLPEGMFVFERAIDREQAEAIIERLVDVVYDRDPTAQEYAFLTDKLLHGTEQIDELAALLRGVSSTVRDVSSNNVSTLTGTALVDKAIWNAYGRGATEQEVTDWAYHISAGHLTENQFLAALSQSVDHMAAGNGHWDWGIAAVTTATGTGGADTITGAGAQNDISGLGGNDTLTGSTSRDVIIGGQGNDTLNGKAGNDVYEWATGDGSDTIYDDGTSLTQIDTLKLTNLASTAGVALTRVGNDLKVTIGLEVLTFTNRFHSATNGYGIEAIAFSDGVTWNLKDILAKTEMNGTSAGESLSGSNYADNIIGWDGNDTIDGNNGDDLLVGGLGTDTLRGDGGNDTYKWATGDGSDTIYDDGTSKTELDILKFTNVTSSGVILTRVGDELKIAIGTEILTLTNMFDTPEFGYGIESIHFSDGEVWNYLDILTKTTMNGTGAGDTLAGSQFADHIYGDTGNDTIDGNDGDDLLVGDDGVDTLRGDAGSDTYEWTTGDDGDTINDDDDSLIDTDVLNLTNVASTGAVLTRVGNDLKVTIGSDVLTVTNRFHSVENGYGIEAISFSDGVTWNLQDILAKTFSIGTGSGETLSGSAYNDNIDGKGGNDTLNGNNGDDLLVGGTGVDTMNGGIGNDLYRWTTGEGNDILNDSQQSLTDVDTLELLNVNSNNLELIKSGSDLQVKVLSTAEIITVTNRLNSSADGRGVELIVLADGVTIEVASSAVAAMITIGTSAANTLAGWNYVDTLSGEAGNDTMDGNGGDDLLIGGTGTDTLRGDAGNDTYEWATGDGSDTIYDDNSSLTQIDTLKLTNVASGDVALTRVGNDLKITIGLEVLTITNRFYSTSSGYGIEAIIFSDGVAWNLQEILAHTYMFGTAAGESLSGSNYADNIDGKEGNDTIDGNNGDDQIVGGLGVDTLRGDAGNDTYVWATGNGNDTINDDSTSLTTTDTLKLTNVASTGVILTKSGNDLKVTVAGTSEVITVQNRFYSINEGRGIEVISFSDGVTWNLQDILAKTTMYGTSSGESLSGSNYADNIDGKDGNDTIDGNDGDDLIIGGLGVDTLRGDAGHDRYQWTTGDGNDTIYDTDTSLTDTDTLILTNFASTGVVLTRVGNDLKIAVGLEVLTITNRFHSVANSYGIEAISFSDGVTWNLDEILARTKTMGTAANETVSGSAYADNLYGLDGNDTLNGNDGNDILFGGKGADTLNGGNGTDTVSYETATQGVKVDLSVTTAQVGNAGGDEVGDIISSATQLIGSTLDDILGGNDVANVIWAGDGNDILTGKAGYDQLFGGDGNDSLEGGTNADLLDGGAGTDTASYVSSSASVSVNLATGATTGGDAQGDEFVSIENLSGSAFGDSLTGDSNNNVLSGLDGNDQLTGGVGNDTLTGGLGNDTFYFATGFGQDTVSDFGAGAALADVISLSLGIAFDSYAEVMAATTQVGADAVITIDASNKIKLTGVLATALVADDFAFV